MFNSEARLTGTDMEVQPKESSIIKILSFQEIITARWHTGLLMMP